jgi:hypothetical protein
MVVLEEKSEDERSDASGIGGDDMAIYRATRELKRRAYLAGENGRKKNGGN